MKKYYSLLSLLICVNLCFSQAPEIKTQLPTIIPPSPSVAALMKFEEVPVSNYTGIPDISIPLFSTPTLSKDINLDLSLKYHPAGVAADEKASDVGLGWALCAGGTISRSVRGLPDELLRLGSDGRIGLYQNSHSNVVYKNDYNYVSGLLKQIIENEFNDFPTDGFDTIDEYLWNVQVRGAFDTEHDLWQYNFLGNSGRFYIKKNNNNQLEIIPLDNDKIKIINYYGGPSTVYDAYRPTSFVIFDEKGYKYIFDVVEVTEVVGLDITEGRLPPNNTVTFTPRPSYIYNSSFHLSKVFDNNNNPILDFIYNPIANKDIVINGTQTNYYEIIQPLTVSLRDYQLNNTCGEGVTMSPYPLENIGVNQTETISKKLQQIRVQGIAKIDFQYTQGRQDENYFQKDKSLVFSGIVIKNWNDTLVKKVNLEHDYFKTISSRMFLTAVNFGNFANTKIEKYKLFYKNNFPSLVLPETIGRDPWNNFNISPSLETEEFYREESPLMCTQELIQKMELPSGGCIIYDFESNTYSHVGSSLLPNFDANLKNWDYDDKTTVFTTLSNNKTGILFTIAEQQNISYKIDIDYLTSATIDNWIFKIYKDNGATPFKYIWGDEGILQKLGELNLPPGTYKIDFSSPQNFTLQPTFNARIKFFYKTRNTNNYQYLYGGGSRIHKIGYFTDGSTDQDYYKSPATFLPEKEKKYDYGFFENINKSSGSLVYNVPLYTYKRTKRECNYCISSGSIGAVLVRDDQMVCKYDVLTSFNNLRPSKTQGADVGYKNVTVSERNNGKSEFVYTSPIDFPEPIGAYNSLPPFLPTSNIDYKRGLLKLEKLYNMAGKILKETNLNYEYEDHVETTGLRTFYFDESDFVNVFNQEFYLDYKNYILTCGQHPLYNNICNGQHLTIKFPEPHCECFCYFGRPRDFINYDFIREAYGWSKLISKSTNEYFYPSGSSLAEILKTYETYEYNALNNKISSSTVRDSEESILKTDYFYHTGNTNGHQNRISEIERIESYKNNVLLSTSKVVYSKTIEGNSSYLPFYIQTSKGSDALESRIKYKRYDDYGHPLELQKENGMLVSYIWGSSDSPQPIAKIENASYERVANTLEIPVSDVNKANISQINSLRALLPTAMVTSYTYQPLVGISTITDPKGDTTTYVYDDFGRLIKVFDNLGNTLSENQYHYRTQN